MTAIPQPRFTYDRVRSFVLPMLSGEYAFFPKGPVGPAFSPQELRDIAQYIEDLNNAKRVQDFREKGAL